MKELNSFLAHASQRVLFFDGAMGTSVHSLNLPLSDYRGCENCTEVLVLSRPDAVARIHRTFFEIGCDCVETDTFGGMPHVLREFDLHDHAREINRKAVEIARGVAQEFATPARPRFVFGSMGPGTKLVSLRQISYDELLDSYRQQAEALLEGGADGLIIETCQDILQTKCAIHAARLGFQSTGRRVPLMVQVTMETTGTMLVGTDIAAALTVIESFPEVDVIGMNCATGPQEMSEFVRFLCANTNKFISVQPNAGLPQLVEGHAHFPLSPAELAKWLREFVDVDGVGIVGGCCGTTPAHLKAVIDTIGTRPPQSRRPAHEPASTSLYQVQPHRQQNSFLIVGERCNTNGSRQFKRLLEAGDVEGMVAMAVEQVQHEGAHVLDVCVDYVGRDGVPDMHVVVDRFAKDVNAPLMLDSTEPPVIEAGLKLMGGKCIVNSVNLEDGEHRLDKVCPLLKQYGAAVVALTIDEHPTEAMAKTADRKLEIAARLHDLLTRKWGIAEEDIFFDCLTFPITTGNREDRRLGLETLDGIQKVMSKFPRCQSILGVSNVSFGLVPAARVVLNSAFLHEARQRGLTAAIVHASKILPRNQISDDRWDAAINLIYDRSEEALADFIALFSAEEKLGGTRKIADLPVEERLKQRIIDGAKVGLEADLDEALKRYPALDIINNLLLDGMKTVGELFGSGQMQLPFVLKSAETMKAAVAHLEPHMERVDGASRGKIVLATVRGDVHDIGKNLVDIILTNNGYTVYNLGIKQPISNVITAMREHNADAIGLSGLLVKSTLVMRDDLHVLNEQQIDIPVILGGAALTRRYVEQDLRAIYKGQLFYASDAFDGLALMGRIAGSAGILPATGSTGAPPVSPQIGTGSKGRHEGTEARRHGGSDEATKRRGDEGKGRSEHDAQAGDSASAAGKKPPTPVGDARKRNLVQLAAEIEQRYGLQEVPDDAGEEAAPLEPVGPTPAMASAGSASCATAVLHRSAITHTHPVPAPPFWGARTVERVPLRAVLAYMNEVMLFQVQWGFRKRGRSKEEFARYIEREVRPIYRELVARCEREEILQPQAIYGYWPCASAGDELIVYEPPAQQGSASGSSNGANRLQELRELVRFNFPRQGKAPYLCLADFWRPLPAGGARISPADPAGLDVVAFQVVTAGQRVSEVARQWFAANEYQQYLYLHGLGVETAEAMAEYFHKQIRIELGVADRDARDINKLFQQGYQGSRYSFGYPACPNLEDQAKLMKLLSGERIGIKLSEEFQLEPEQSTSAIVTYHPDARYFNVR